VTHNDHYGHLAGDQTLRAVADCLSRAVRYPDDLACRYGGEEFVLVLPRTGLDAAQVVADRFRQQLAEAAVPHALSAIADTVTASVGICVARASVDLAPIVLLDAADRALYQAKTRGRDQSFAVRLEDAAEVSSRRRSPGRPARA
jgi:diguanylate cyclase (GGDEF)-like protein